MLVFFRACEANLSPGSLATTEKRWLNYTKQEILYKCWLSLQKELTENDCVHIVCDRVTDTTKKWFKNNSNSDIVIKDINPLSHVPPYGEHPYPNYHYGVVNHCIEFFEYFFDVIEVLSEDIVYICEDDYLHTNNWRKVLDNLFNKNYEGFYLPYDYPDRYSIDNTRQCDLHVIGNHHYRTVPSSTLTMVSKAKTFNRYKIDLLRAGVFAEDSWTWKVFKQNICLCPIPGTSTHLQNNCITPIIDWENVWNNV